ncbi:MAG: BamA/TamA family outer membrane protein [Bacteroidales bacterium]|nr:BamA/TamA family outer membrane protein [Bacteroidales bacterium]
MNRIPHILLLVLALASCSTTRVLEDGQYRLTGNEISFTDEPELTEGDLSNYIRQTAGNGGLLGFNPFLYVYNWSKRDGLFHKLGVPPVVYDESSVGTSIVNITNRLRYLGYYSAQVDTSTVREGKKIRVNYNVSAGSRYRIDSVIFDIPPYGPFKDDFLADEDLIRSTLTDNFLSEALLEEESARSAARLRDLGYYTLNRGNYSFEADTVDGKAVLQYRVREYERSQVETSARPLNKFTIGKVAISIPKDMRFKESVLKGLNTVKPGSFYSESEVATTYNRMSSLKVFSGGGIEMVQDGDSKVDCNINLSRSPVQGFKVKAEGSTNSSGLMALSPQFSYFHKNVFGGGEWLNLSFNGDFQFSLKDDTRATEYGVSTGISFPRFLGLPYRYFKRRTIPRTEFNVAFNHQNRPEYTRNVLSVSYGYSGTSRSNVAYQLIPLRVNFVKLFDLDAGFNATLANNPYMKYAYQDHLDAGIGMVAYYNSSREIVPAGNYHFRRISIDLSGNALSLLNSLMDKNADGAYCIGGSPYAQYVRAEYSFGRTWRYGPQDATAIATRILAGAGIAYGNSSAMPFEKQFYAGGASSMRGWQARALGPGFSTPDASFAIPSQTGDFKLEANVEYRFPMVWKLEGALFADVGNVWNFADIKPETVLQSLAADWGAGIRLNLTFILLRIDFGMKLRDPSLPDGARLIGASHWLKNGNNAIHFGIGYPF